MTSYEDGHLPLFKSPLLHPGDGGHHGPSPGPEESKAVHGSETSMMLENNDEALHDMPQFHHHEESTNAELFYDLFFVANLTVFTNVHEVNDHYTLTQYVGFFAILLVILISNCSSRP